MPFQKGNKLASMNKGKKYKKTLEKEARRAIFEIEIAKKWIPIINNLKPEYVADQYMGKAPDELNLRIPKPILDGLSNNNSNKKDSKSSEKNQGN